MEMLNSSLFGGIVDNNRGYKIVFVYNYTD